MVKMLETYTRHETMFNANKDSDCVEIMQGGDIVVCGFSDVQEFCRALCEEAGLVLFMLAVDQDVKENSNDNS